MNYCEQCRVSVELQNLRCHLEECHVGWSPEEEIQLFCGSCSFRASKRDLEWMVRHCHLSGHTAGDVLIEWRSYQQMESNRLLDLIRSGVNIMNGENSLLERDSNEELTILPRRSSIHTVDEFRDRNPREKNTFLSKEEAIPKRGRSTSAVKLDATRMKRDYPETTDQRQITRRGRKKSIVSSMEQSNPSITADCTVGFGKRPDSPVCSKNESGSAWLNISKASISYELPPTPIPTQEMVAISVSSEDEDAPLVTQTDKDGRQNGSTECSPGLEKNSDSIDVSSHTNVRRSEENDEDYGEEGSILLETRKRALPGKKLWAWEYFEEMEDENGAKFCVCTICPTKKKLAGGNPGNLSRHIMGVHKHQVKELQAAAIAARAKRMKSGADHYILSQVQKIRRPESGTAPIRFEENLGSFQWLDEKIIFGGHLFHNPKDSQQHKDLSFYFCVKSCKAWILVHRYKEVVVSMKGSHNHTIIDPQQMKLIQALSKFARKTPTRWQDTEAILWSFMAILSDEGRAHMPEKKVAMSCIRVAQGSLPKSDQTSTSTVV